MIWELFWLRAGSSWYIKMMAHHMVQNYQDRQQQHLPVAVERSDSATDKWERLCDLGEEYTQIESVTEVPGGFAAVQRSSRMQSIM